MPKPLRNKTYLVTDRKKGVEIPGAFVLRPEIDAAARAALATYAEVTHNERAAQYIRKRLHELSVAKSNGGTRNGAGA